MSHIALYRAWRPQAFRDVVGQRHIMQTLQNALRESRYSHAYLFSGPRGTGKTSAAKILAKALNCEQGPGPEPCNQCAACVGITEGSVLDVVEIDAASNRGVEEIRDIRDKVKYAPTAVRHKVYIIDEVHMLTTEAFNALLKTLEEPPPHVVFVLATTEPGRIPATIISRCQRFDFRRISVEDQVERLAHICREEGIEADDEALKLLALMSEGGMRDALSMLDQVVAFSGHKLTKDDVLSAMGGIAGEQFAALASALHERDIAKVLDLTDQLMQDGKSADKCLESLIQFYRDLLLVKLVPDASVLEGRILNPASLTGLAKQYGQERIFRIIETLNRYQQEMKYSPRPQLILEVALMKICAESEAEKQTGVEAAGAESSAGTPPAPGPATAETAAMQAALKELRRKVEALERRLATAAPPSAGVQTHMPDPGGAPWVPFPESAAPPPSVSTGTPVRRAPASASKGGNAARGARAEAVDSPSLNRLKEYLQAVDSYETREVQTNWNRVLQMLKEMNQVSVRAWLVNGEPVAATQNVVLVAFRNLIHQQTTEKPANRELIEQALHKVFGRPLALATILQSQWKGALEQSGAAAGEPPPELELVAEEPGTEPPQEDWVSKAFELFGENLVEIQDD